MNTTNNYLSEKLKKNNVVKFNKHSVTLANYSPYSISNNMLFISGQLPIVDGNLKYVGKIDHDLKKNEAGIETKKSTSKKSKTLAEADREKLDKKFSKTEEKKLN